MTIIRPDPSPADARSYLVGLLAGLACGLAAGGAVALLFAPASGRDSRARLMAEGRAARSRTAEWFNRTAAIELVRRKGIRGLVRALRSPARQRTASG
jgi:gas vesicle protein